MKRPKGSSQPKRLDDERNALQTPIGNRILSRAGNNPKRRVVPVKQVTNQDKQRLLEHAHYVGSGHHKRNPADYKFERTNPRPTKSLCDLNRVITLKEAMSLMKKGIQLGLFSNIDRNGFPKFIWSVSDNGEVFEAKTDSNGTGHYHGYPLEDEDAMCEYIQSEWERRCQELGQ